jgi:hypothetical protein
MFSCDICSKEFKRKQHLEYHLVNNVCINTKKILLKCTICDKGYSNQKWLDKHTVNCTISTNQHSPQNSAQIDKPLVNTCELCNKTFSDSYCLKRHVAKFCKVKKLTNINESSKDILIEEQIKFMKEQQELIYKLMDKIGNTTNNVNSNNTVTQNIQLNGFGEEDLSFLTDNMKAMICNTVYGSVAKCIEIIHMDDSRPENKTMRIKSRKRNEIEKYNGKKKKWEICDLMEGVKDLIGHNYDRVLGFYDDSKVKSKMSTSKINRFDKFIEDMDDELPEVMSRLETDAKKLIKNFD